MLFNCFCTKRDFIVIACSERSKSPVTSSQLMTACGNCVQCYDIHGVQTPRIMRQKQTSSKRQNISSEWRLKVDPVINTGTYSHTLPPQVQQQHCSWGGRQSPNPSPSRPLRGSDLYIHLPQLASLNTELSRLLIKDTQLVTGELPRNSAGKLKTWAQ